MPAKSRPKECLGYCYRKIDNGNTWRHKLCDCSGYLQLCCRSYWCPCWIHGRTAESVNEPFCQCCCFSVLGCAGCWAGMRIRGRVREKYNIEGSWQKDCAMGYFCGICSLLQMALEVESHKDFKVKSKKEKKEKKLNGDLLDDEEDLKDKKKTKQETVENVQESKIDEIDLYY